jgi:hypothetical protein
MDWHDTADEARGACEAALTAFRELASEEGWSDDVTSVAWGETRERVVQTAHGSHECDCDASECDATGEHDSWCPAVDGGAWADYALKPVEDV